VVVTSASSLPVHATLEPDRRLAIALGGTGPQLEEPGAGGHAVLLEVPALRDDHQVELAFGYNVAPRVRLLAADRSVVREVDRSRYVVRAGYRYPRQATVFLNVRDRPVRFLLITLDPSVPRSPSMAAPIAGPAPEFGVAPPLANTTIELKRYQPETAAAAR